MVSCLALFSEIINLPMNIGHLIFSRQIKTSPHGISLFFAESSG